MNLPQSLCQFLAAAAAWLPVLPTEVDADTTIDATDKHAWAAKLRTRGLFPIEATVTFAGREMVRFEVQLVDRARPAVTADSFAVPSRYHPTPLLPF
jgi:hypothetical protein